VSHARLNVEGIIQRKRLRENSLVVELASNDGYLLQWFAEAGIPVLGIDPAPGPAASAIEKGVPTLIEFFDRSLARRLTEEGRHADVILGNNVLAHVPDQNEFVEAMECLLAPGGTIVMEFPYLRDLIDHCEFDTIYHEHACYFSVTSVKRLFRTHGLDLVRVEHHPIHGGSLRVYFERDGSPESSVATYLESEHAIGMLGATYYEDFAVRVQRIREDLIALIDLIVSEGARVAAYGAAAKGAIMLNFCDIGVDQLNYVVDRNTHKHGLEMPGIPLRIEPVERLASDPPDYLLILAWNFRDEIMRQQSAFAARGGRFMIPLPTPMIL
jgi:SAM-dependent methyltransferase